MPIVYILPPCYVSLMARVIPHFICCPEIFILMGFGMTLGLDEAAEAAINKGDIPPLLIVMADSGVLLNNTSGGPWSYETQILDDLIPFIESHYCTWSESAGQGNWWFVARWLLVFGNRLSPPGTVCQCWRPQCFITGFIWGPGCHSSSNRSGE